MDNLFVFHRYSKSIWQEALHPIIGSIKLKNDNLMECFESYMLDT